MHGMVHPVYSCLSIRMTGTEYLEMFNMQDAYEEHRNHEVHACQCIHLPD